MKAFLKSQTVSVALIIIVFVVSIIELSAFIANERLEDIESTLTVAIVEQKSLLTTIAETTARNGADSVTETIIRDCSIDERAAFDSLLSRLDAQLTQTELRELERLFGRCGSFYAERKSVMVSRLLREIEVFSSQVSQLETIKKGGVEDYRVVVWQSLGEQERIQSEQFTKLITIQDSIIKTLLSGKSAASPEVKAILEEAKATQTELTIANKKAAELRAALTAL
jgi:hypothetical protein